MFYGNTKKLFKEVIMNISPVSFRSTTATPHSDFSTLISRPQTYTQKEQPVAAAELQVTGKKKSPLKTILGIVVAAAGVAAGLALGAKHGIFNPKANGNKHVETLKAGLKYAGDQISAWGKSAGTFIKTKWGELKNHLPKTDEVIEAVEDVAEDVVSSAADTAGGTN